MSISEPLRVLSEALTLETPIKIVDVGANPIEGDAPYKELLDAGLCEVIGFEPQEAELAKLNAVKSERETYLPYALGDGEIHTLHLFRHSGFTSVFPIDDQAIRMLGRFWRATREIGEIQVETHRLDDIPEIGMVDFLKIDVQGAEKMIIENGLLKLSSCLAIQTEVRYEPIYIGEPTFGELDATLRSAGYSLHSMLPVKRAFYNSTSIQGLRRLAARQVIDGDAHYVRGLRDPEAMATDDLIKLALLACSVMDSHDLVLRVIDILAVRDPVLLDLAATYLAALPAGYRR